MKTIKKIIFMILSTGMVGFSAQNVLAQSNVPKFYCPETTNNIKFIKEQEPPPGFKGYCGITITAEDSSKSYTMIEYLHGGVNSLSDCKKREGDEKFNGAWNWIADAAVCSYGTFPFANENSVLAYDNDKEDKTKWESNKSCTSDNPNDCPFVEKSNQ